MRDWDKPSQDYSILIVGAVVIVLILLGGGGLFAYRQTALAREMAERASAEALSLQGEAGQAPAGTEIERNKSKAITKFLAELLREPNPNAGGRDMTVRDVLDAAEVEAKQPDLDPVLREAVERVIRRARAKLGEKR